MLRTEVCPVCWREVVAARRFRMHLDSVGLRRCPMSGEEVPEAAGVVDVDAVVAA